VNPRAAAFAARATGRTVHCRDVAGLAAVAGRFDAVTFVDVLEHIVDPRQALVAAWGVLAPGGWIAVKVPHGPNQLRKEILRSRLQPGYRATVADNLVHVGHFTPGSLRLALERAGFADVRVEVAPPVLWGEGALLRRRVLANAVRLGVYGIGRALPGGIRTPAALNLQAYARRPVA
jgi:SAM-dependent methyltransferase